MILLGMLIGIFAQCIFVLGLLRLYFPLILGTFTSLYFVVGIGIIFSTNKNEKISFKFIRKLSRLDIIYTFLLCLLLITNLVSAISPELSFDALWYHLTLPKLYLLKHQLWHIPGGLLYYSDMPKLGELLFIPILQFTNEIGAKLVQYIFGVLTLVVIYKTSRTFVNRTLSLLACLVFYSNLVVDWESTVAYVDLIRTFFEVCAFLSFLMWFKSKQNKYFYIAALLVGFAIETKLIALPDIAIFAFMSWFNADKIITTSKKVILIFRFAVLCLLPSLSWFIFSTIHTGNPIYPFFTNVYPTHLSISLLNPMQFVYDIFIIFTKSDDPISPIYIIVLPLALFYWKRFSKIEKNVFIYSVLAIIGWYLTPRTGGGRFMLPYLPVLSIATVMLIHKINTKINFVLKKQMYYSLIIIVCLIALISIGYRSIANKRYIPYLLHKETKNQFLSQKLNFFYGDFYDVDGFFSRTILSSDRVLLYGFHNLYYVNFPFIDSSWIQSGDSFNYIATQNTSLPANFKNWKLVYINKITHVRLYSLHKEWFTYQNGYFIESNT